MNRGWKHIVSILSIVLMLVVAEKESFAQKIDAFARVSVSPREGVVRQPYKVNISVYSSTWFAKPLQFANLRIDNAFIIPFTRTVSGINYINNKKYATLTFYYLVFPYNTGTLTIPELEINASIPPEGDYKGQAHVIRTKAQRIKVNAVPSAKDELVWMVAKNISVKEIWSKALESLKVGDVVEREITISANGTLPTLIQPLKIEKPELVSIYPKEPELQDKRNNQDVNGVRTEKYSYLFEEEGKVFIPEEEFLWWNPQTKRVYKRTIPERKLSILANPDLAMLESLKDSLLAMSASVDLQAEEKPIPWVQIGIFVVLVFLILYIGRKTILLVVGHKKEQRAIYYESEAYYFKKIQQALSSNNTNEFIRALYVWFDKARKPEQNAAIYYFLNSEEKELLENLVQNNDASLTSEQKKKLSLLSQNLRQYILHPVRSANEQVGLNPV